MLRPDDSYEFSGNGDRQFFSSDRCCPEGPWSDFARDFVWSAALSVLRRTDEYLLLTGQLPLFELVEQPFAQATRFPGFGRDGFAAGPEAVRNAGPTPPGYAAEKWENPNYHSIKYDVSRNLARVLHQLHAIPDEAGRKQFMEAFLYSQIPVIEALGGRVLAIKNEKLLLDAGDGSGPHWIDTVRAIETDAAVQWLPVDGPIPASSDRTVPPSAHENTQPSPEALPPCPPGFDAGKWNNPNHRTIKYEVGRNFARIVHQLHAIPDEAGRKRFAEEFLKSQIPVIEALGGKVLAVKNEKIYLDAGDGPHWIDTIRDIGGDAAVQWLPV